MTKKQELIDFLKWYNPYKIDYKRIEDVVDLYLADHKPKGEGLCHDCGWKHPDKYDCLCPDSCDEITDQWKPIKPTV
jgi:hypothetical protein